MNKHFLHSTKHGNQSLSFQLFESIMIRDDDFCRFLHFLRVVDWIFACKIYIEHDLQKKKKKQENRENKNTKNEFA